jgi:preprotein translocase SecF subunit
MNYKNARFDFVKQRNKFFIISAVLIVIGFAILFVKGLNLGIDFTSGTRVEVSADHSISVDKVRQEFHKLGLNPVKIVSAGQNNHMASARFDSKLSQKEQFKIENHFQKIYGSKPSVSTVSPQVGRTLAKNAMLALAVASIGIILYVWVRFEILQGLAAIVALLHDSFFIVAVFSLLRLEVNAEFIAAVLTIVGYSINDTIVLFDRIRENTKKAKRIKGYSDLAEIVDRSIYQTLTRSINTVLTVVIAALALLIFGSESIRNFAFALTVGLIAGTYSSIFIAAQLWVVWKTRALKRKKVKPKHA